MRARALLLSLAALSGCSEPAPAGPASVPEPGGELRRLGDAAFDENRRTGDFFDRFRRIGPYSVWASRHYLLRSRLPDSETRAVAGELDRFYEKVWDWIRIPHLRPEHPQLLPVFLLPETELKDHLFQDAPVYMPAERALYAPPGNGLFREGARQALHLVFDLEAMPPWLREGIAEHVDDPTGIHEGHAKEAGQALQRGLLAFRQLPPRPRGWALVHWLWTRDESGAYRRWMDRLATADLIPPKEIEAAEHGMMREALLEAPLPGS